MILTSEAGSGKTLAYLLPIMNGLFHHPPKKGHPRFRLTKETEDQMYLNAEEIAHRAA
jgi:superfamily II DNA/RNA helicase